MCASEPGDFDLDMDMKYPLFFLLSNKTHNPGVCAPAKKKQKNGVGGRKLIASQKTTQPQSL